MTVTLTNHPTVTKTEEGEITFDTQCKEPFSFSASEQDSVPADKYTDTDLIWTPKPFNIEPAQCIDTIKYTCWDILDVTLFGANLLEGDPRLDGKPTLYYEIFCLNFADETVLGVPEDEKINFRSTEIEYFTIYKPPG